MIKKSIYISVFSLFIAMVISCEKDFQDIATSVISNTKFETNDTIIEVVVTNKQITSVRGDGLAIGGTLGQYLLGVYNNPNYEKIEASIVSQLALDENLNALEEGEKLVYGSDTTFVVTIDTVFLKLPYQATLTAETTSEYTLDSIIGDPTRPFTLNVYRTDTYLNRLNPVDPSKLNVYQSDHTYQILPDELNATVNYQFMPNALDTVLLYKRRLNNGVVYKVDTVALTGNIPFARVPLDENKIKQIFVDQYETPSFETQEAINEYFKGLYLKAEGNEGSLISFNINNSDLTLRPSIEIKYTKTVLKGGTEIVDTIPKSSTFLLSNFSNSIYKMDEKTYPDTKNAIIQGTAGNMAKVQFLGGNDLTALRNKNWLINDAALTFYVDQNIVGYDTISTPFRLFLYKNGTVKSQIKDVISEGPSIFGGNLVITDKKPDYYTFKITDYISDLLNGNINNNLPLELKVYNVTDFPTSVVDTIVKDYSWNPKAVALLNHLSSNGTRRAQLKISYSKKK